MLAQRHRPAVVLGRQRRPAEHVDQPDAGHDVELPRLEALLQDAGWLSRPVHDITFSGLQLSDATWNAPSQASGLPDVQSNLAMTMPGGNQGE